MWAGAPVYDPPSYVRGLLVSSLTFLVQISSDFHHFLRPLSARHLEAVRQQHQRDLSSAAGWVALPGGLERKYPNAGREWGWQWVFPATGMYVDRETGKRRRHHLHESAVQRSVKEAVRRAGIAKPATCHLSAVPPAQAGRLRHSGVYPAFVRDYSPA